MQVVKRFENLNPQPGLVGLQTYGCHVLKNPWHSFGNYVIFDLFWVSSNLVISIKEAGGKKATKTVMIWRYFRSLICQPSCHQLSVRLISRDHSCPEMFKFCSFEPITRTEKASNLWFKII